MLYLDTQVVSTLLPVHLAVGHVEQVLDPDLVLAGQLQQHHTSRNILYRHGIIQLKLPLTGSKRKISNTTRAGTSWIGTE